MVAPVFFGALASLVLLFALRAIEERRGARFAPGIRRALDRFARTIKAIILVVADMLGELPRISSYLLRALAVMLVRRFAHTTESISRAAHSVADMVSYKHCHERREPRAAFLKEVKKVDPAEDVSNS